MMSREFLFRGKGDKRYNDGVWIYGVPIRDFEGDWQICTDSCKRVVIPETIGEHTGLTDKNGVKIFEGDIVHFKTTAYHFKNCRIKYQSCYARYCAIDNKGYEYPMDKAFVYEVIGNIHDNPEMLREV